MFEDWSEEELLKKLPKDHVIIMDNAAFHKKEVLQNLAGKYSQTLIFLLPYSPEYNPIEHKRSALKRKLLAAFIYMTPFLWPGCYFIRQLTITAKLEIF